MRSTPWRLRVLPVFLFPLLALGLTGCGSGTNPETASTLTAPLTGTSVAVDTLASEDLLGPCHFDLLLAPAPAQAGVFVVYERGDSAAIFMDPAVRSTMAGLNYAMIWAHQCNAASSRDLQANAAAGPARVLTAALTAFATQTGHPELAQAPVIPFGFSAAGVLSVTLAAQLPTRVQALVAYASGSPYFDLDSVQVTPVTGAIPSLVLANAADTMAGDARSLRLFNRGRTIGAPWAFAVQSGTAHCCALSTRSLMLPWITALVNSKQRASLTPSWGTLAGFSCPVNQTLDSSDERDCTISSPSLAPATSSLSQTIWVPDAVTAQAWLTWVTSPVTNE